MLRQKNYFYLQIGFIKPMETDILERLKNSSKINGAYPRDIADAIKEIERLRSFCKDLANRISELESELSWVAYAYQR